jgi:hypothetical protein
VGFRAEPCSARTTGSSLVRGVVLGGGSLDLFGLTGVACGCGWLHDSALEGPFVHPGVGGAAVLSFHA